MNTVVVPRASPARRAMLRLQGGPLSGPVHHVALVVAPCLPALAGVAVNSIALAMAITVQVARGQGFLGGLRTGVYCRSGLPRHLFVPMVSHSAPLAFAGRVLLRPIST